MQYEIILNVLHMYASRITHTNRTTLTNLHLQKSHHVFKLLARILAVILSVKIRALTPYKKPQRN